jgi:hypothetical protein
MNRKFDFTFIKRTKWLWLFFALLLLWQIFSNIRSVEMMKNNNPNEWNPNGANYHK